MKNGAISGKGNDDHLSCMERLCDNSECMWLSSDSKSLSFLDSDDLQDAWGYECWDSFPRDRFLSMLSLLPRSSNVTSDKHSVGCSESGDSSYERSFSDDSSLFESSCSSMSVPEDQPSCLRNLDRTDIWVSSLDLDAEKTALYGDKGQGFEVFTRDFPSPSFRSRKRNQFLESIAECSSSSATESSSHLELSESDEPIFWPLDYIYWWCPELDKFLYMPPQRGGKRVSTLGPDPSKQMRLRFREKMSSIVNNQRKIRFGSKPNQTQEGKSSGPANVARNGPAVSRQSSLKQTQEGKLSGPDNVVSRKGPALSRQSSLKQTQEGKSSGPANVVSRKGPAPLRQSSLKRSSSMKGSRKPHSSETSRKDPGSDTKSLPKHPEQIEPCGFQNYVVNGVPIEKLIGLREFDGHEGITSNFNEDEFFLIHSPRKNKGTPASSGSFA